MERRSERHTEVNKNVAKISREQKNKYLYDDINTKIGYEDFVNLDTQTRIDLSSLVGLNTNREEYQKTKDYRNLLGKLEERPKEVEKNINPVKKVFDINDVLEEARKNRTEIDELEKKRKIRNNEYFVPKDFESENKSTNEINEEELINIIDEINTKDLSKELEQAENELFKDLIESDDKEESTEGIAAEAMDEQAKEKQKLIDSFYTKSMELSKKDFDSEDDDFIEKSGKTKYIIIVIILLIGLIVAGYFFCKKQGII